MCKVRSETALEPMAVKRGWSVGSGGMLTSKSTMCKVPLGTAMACSSRKRVVC